VRDWKEVVFREHPLEPVGQALLVNLNNSVAVGTDQMMVMRLSAKPVAELSLVVSECVHDAFLAQQRERSVDGRETDRRSARLTKTLPQCLRRHVIGLGGQLAKHLQSLARDLDIVPRQQIGEIWLYRLRWFHAERTIADVITRIILISIISLLLAGLVVFVFVTGGQSNPKTTRLNVVAAENFYGDIARQIGGSQVAVTSILSDPNADPHLFEPGTGNGLAVASAALIIQNGLGYDAFMQKLERAAPSNRRIVITISEALGFHGADTNPHIWYDVTKLGAIASAIASGLERADAPHAAAYRSGLARFEASLLPLTREIAKIRSRFAGEPVAYTEPVPGYLIAAAGLRNVAPATFTRAIENGSEPSPQDVAAMTALMTERRIKVLLYNSQAVSPITSSIRTAANRAGIPVVGMTETMPGDSTFQLWLLDETRALYDALSR
jgi:zinc/manganese transport system substrate-binding protein